ncbi:hypothetical protein Tco_1080015 [Tanacetum coccineum]|uniref:Uncharacterized protein n=1 Tax=Tanacetum coccineum TaxID=301880 RepID=A0ABQ5HV08_9ASTR
MHNNIMAAGSKDRPPMLGPGRYSQWHSRFLRYLDTKSNGEYLRKCIFEGNLLLEMENPWSLITPEVLNDDCIDKEINLPRFTRCKNKTEDTTPRYNNDNQSGKFGNQRTMTVARARETVGRIRKPKRVKDYREFTREDDDVQTTEYRRSQPAESSSNTDTPLNMYRNHDETECVIQSRRQS